jgi:hypothetical protein
MILITCMLDRLDRLRPLHSALYNAWGAPDGCKEGSQHLVHVSEIFDWMNSSDDRVPVFWMYGDTRFVTTAIAQSVAARAHQQGRLLASYMFSWTGDAARSHPAHLIATIMYQVALFDKDFLHRITTAINMDRDIRDKTISLQISVLLKLPFRDLVTTPGPGPTMLVVIDALDACDQLDDPGVARDIGLFIQTLTAIPWRIKILITSCFTSVLRQMFANAGFPEHRSLSIPNNLADYPFQNDRVSPMSSADRGVSLSCAA